MRAYIDSDILIWHLRKESKAKKFLLEIKNNSAYELWIGAMQRAEIVFFLRDKEIEETEALLSLFKTASVDQVVIDKSGALYRKWNPKTGLGTNDAILASTAIISGGIIFTQNIKHYPMPEVVAKKGWRG